MTLSVKVASAWLLVLTTSFAFLQDPTDTFLDTEHSNNSMSDSSSTLEFHHFKDVLNISQQAPPRLIRDVSQNAISHVQHTDAMNRQNTHQLCTDQ